MQMGVCSYSFHRLLRAGLMDMFQYIAWNDKHGFSQLDPWMAHLEPGYADDDYIHRVKQAADACGLPFACLAIDGAHIYEEDESARASNRARARRWMDIAAMLGARQVRIDAGGPADLTDEILEVIVDGYADVMDYARAHGLEVLMENHWGATQHAANVVRILEAISGLGLLLDTDNWAPGEAEQAAPMCAEYTRHTHVKTYPGQDNEAEALRIADYTIETLWAAGYRGPWGIECIALEGEEEAGVLAAQEYIQEKVGALMAG